MPHIYTCYIGNQSFCHHWISLDEYSWRHLLIRYYALHSALPLQITRWLQNNCECIQAPLTANSLKSRPLSVPFLIRTSGISQPSRLGYGDPTWGGCIVYDKCTLTKFVSSACMFCIADECHQNDVKRFSISWRLLPSPCINWQCISGDKVSWLNSNIVHVCNYRKIWCKIPFLHFFIQEREVFLRHQHDRHPNPNHFHSLLPERVLCQETTFFPSGTKTSIW